MKNIMLILAMSITQFALAVGNEGGGGGDLCEDRIQVIRDDIKGWIEKGGPRKGLKLPKGVSIDQYSKAMIEHINVTKIRCVKPGDKGYPILVKDAPKVCQFTFVDERFPTFIKEVITCDYNIFLNKKLMSESDQYVLIHHEFAGLAGIESPDESISTYSISNQISGYLESQVVQKLVIKNPESKHNNYEERDTVIPKVPLLAFEKALAIQMSYYGVDSIKILSVGYRLNHKIDDFFSNLAAGYRWVYTRNLVILVTTNGESHKFNCEFSFKPQEDRYMFVNHCRSETAYLRNETFTVDPETFELGRHGKRPL